MNTLKKLAKLQVEHLYFTEKQCLIYLKVLGHKLLNPLWKESVAIYYQITELKTEKLHQLMEVMHIDEGSGNTAGINGIISEGFEQIEREKNPAIVDTIILRTIISSAHYKLGNYRMLLSYLKSLNQTYEIEVVQAILDQEQKGLLTLMKLLQTKAASASVRKNTSALTLPNVTQSFQQN